MTAAVRAFVMIPFNFKKIATRKLKTLPYLDEIMPGIEKMYLLSNEADVVRASGQHLIYPVNKVLSEIFPGVIICNSEVTYMNQSRFDMRWAISRPGQGDLTLAILEFKVAHVLHWIDFAKGVCTYEDEEAWMDAATVNDPPTHLKNNAITISRQPTKYSKLCPDIAVFDWNSLMIFDFSTMDQDENCAAHGAFFQETSGATFRLVLLGWLITSLSEYV